jgi:hypothetical protein
MTGSRCVIPIVEGEGEVEAVPILLRRICAEWGGLQLAIQKPIRQPRGKLLKPAELSRALGLARKRMREYTGLPGFVLLMVDADEDMACELGPRLLKDSRQAASDLDVAVVLPVREYENWFTAAAESLAASFRPGQPGAVPQEPEAGSGKKWVANFLGAYSPTADQARLTSAMNLQLCRQRSPSFDKLCRELEKRHPAHP